MSNSEARRRKPGLPVRPIFNPDVRYAEALGKLMERSMSSQDSTNQHEQDGVAILRLRATAPIIEDIRHQFRSPSFSVGLLHRGRIAYTRGYGYANNAIRRKPDPQTIYRAGAHGFTAVILSLLEQARRVSFDGAFGSLSESYPEILEYNPKFAERSADEIHLEDVLSHCTGLAAAPFAFKGVNGSVFAQQRNILHIFANLPSVNGLRSEWSYAEWSYVMIAAVVDKVSHLPWAQAVDDILGRLGLMRTYSNRIVDDNYARAYSLPGDDLTSRSSLVEVDDAFQWSGSVRTCVADLLKWCRLLIKASQPHTFDGESNLSRAIHPVSIYDPETLTRNRVFTALWTILQPDTPLDHDSSQTYATGLYSLTLPTPRLNAITNNQNVTMGADSAPRRVIGHTGDIGSFCSAYWVFPETESAVVVLTNANKANGDPSNIVAQVLIQALFDLQPAIDYKKVAAEVVLSAKSQWESSFSEWRRHRLAGTKPNHPNAYIGDYTNLGLRMNLSVTHKPPSRPHETKEGKLILCINGIKEQTFELHHYHRDSWTFMPASRDECLRLGYGIYIPCWQSFILEFGPFDSSCCSRWVRWRLDPDPRVMASVFTRTVEKGYAASE